MTKQNIIDYVMQTPHNTNKAVLSSMLDSIETSNDKEERVNTFLITITKNEETGNYQADKSFNDTLTAYENGNELILYLEEPNGNPGYIKHIMPCSEFLIIEDDGVTIKGFLFKSNEISETGAEGESSEKGIHIKTTTVNFYTAIQNGEILAEEVEVKGVDFYSDARWSYREI